MRQKAIGGFKAAGGGSRRLGSRLLGTVQARAGDAVERADRWGEKKWLNSVF